jgi:hypothetical protein
VGRLGRAAICASLAAAWAYAPSLAHGEDEAVGRSQQPSPSEQLAEIGIEVPSRVIAIPRGETVLERERPELDPLGVRAGGFIIYPRLDVAEEFSDNIFAEDGGGAADLLTRIIPRLRVESDWNNHALAFFGSGDFGRYLDNSSENYEDFRVGTSGRVDVRRDTKLRARAEFQNRHEERSSPDDVSGKEPTEYDVISGQVEGYQRFNRLNFTLGGAIDRLDFDDVDRAAGPPIDNDDRDRNEIEASLRAGYELVPNYEAFVRGAYLIRDYDEDSDVVVPLGRGLDRDSHGFEAVVGVGIDFGGITFGDFFAGYRRQKFDDAVLDTVEGPVLGADITWNVTPLTTIIGTISREIRETTTEDGSGNFASGRFFTTVGVSAQHELLRNLLLGADASYSQDDFDGIDRTDHIVRFGVNANYMLYRNLYVRGGYKLRARESEFAGEDFLENVVFVRLQVQY